MRAKDMMVLGILLWLMLRDRPSSDVNITVTEPDFPPNVIDQSGQVIQRNPCNCFMAPCHCQ